MTLSLSMHIYIYICIYLCAHVSGYFAPSGLGPLEALGSESNLIRTPTATDPEMKSCGGGSTSGLQRPYEHKDPSKVV